MVTRGQPHSSQYGLISKGLTTARAQPRPRFEDTSATAPMRRLFLNLVSKQLNWLCTAAWQHSAVAAGFVVVVVVVMVVVGIGWWLLVVVDDG